MAKKKAKLMRSTRQPSNDRECSILDIGNDMLCAVFAHLDFEVNRHVVPLVCKKFAAAAAGPSTIWRYLSIMANSRGASGPNMLRWLHKRIAAVQNLRHSGGVHSWSPSWSPARLARDVTLPIRACNLMWTSASDGGCYLLGQDANKAMMVMTLAATAAPELHTLTVGRWDRCTTHGDCLSLLPAFVSRLRHISLSNISSPVHEAHLNAAFKTLRGSLETFHLEVSEQHAAGTFRACAFPAAICGCSRLRSLHMASSVGAFNFGELPAAASWASLSSLTHLRFLNCKVRTFPALNDLTALQETFVQCTSAQGELVPLALPAEVLLPHLTELRLDALAALPVAGPASLVSLTLNRCQFGATLRLRQLAGTLQSLQVLHILSSPSVRGVVGALAQLTQLTQLQLCNCALISLPPELSELQALEIVSLAHNEFRTLPPVIGAWRRCEVLFLSKNYNLGLEYLGVPPGEDGEDSDYEDDRAGEVAEMLTSLTALSTLGLYDSPHAAEPDAMHAAMRTLVDVQRGLPNLEIQLLELEDSCCW